MVFDPGYALEILPRLLAAAIVTIEAALLGFVVAAVLGLLVAIVRLGAPRPIGAGVAVVTEAIRVTPLLIQLFIAWYVLAPKLPTLPSAFVVGVLVLGIHYSTYCSEVYRAGILGVPRGQWEAAHALNLTTRTTWRRVILPQAVPPMIPALGNYLISMLKETPLLFAITVVELFATSQIIVGERYRLFEPILLVGLIFLLLSYPAALIVRRIEVRYGRS